MSLITLSTGGKRLAVSDVNQDVTSNATLVDSLYLAAPVDMDHRYSYEANIPFRLLGTVSGYRFGLTAPGAGSGTILTSTMEVLNASLNTIVEVSVDQTAPINLNGALASVGLHILRMKGLLVVANGFASDYNDPSTWFKFQFAQNVSDGSAIRILAGATMEIEDYG